MKWKNFSIQTKILAVGGIIILSFVSTIFLTLMPAIESSIYDMKKEKIKDIVDMTIATINGMYRDYEAGTITKEQLAASSAEYIRRIRYGNDGKDYLWINDYHPRMVMHPYRPDMNGKDLSSYKDKQGKLFFVDMVNLCRAKGAGYISYLWQYKDDATKIEEKISYVRAIPEMEWVIGTGVYDRDIRAEMRDRVVSLNIRIAVIVSAITVVMIVLVFFISRAIRKSIDQCASFAEDLANGNFTNRINIEQKDEIGCMAKTLNESADNLEKLITDVVHCSFRLNDVVEEIVKGNQQLSQMTTEQASALEEIASSIEESLSGIKNNADNAGEADKVSVIARDNARNGESIVLNTISSIEEINVISRKIADIIEMINEIAFQTNLLALNASVEAARVGDSGRGFAVVATEVRNLAQRAASAAKEIESVVSRSLEIVNATVSMGHQSKEALRKITESIAEASEMIRNIAIASDEQRVGIEQLSSAIFEIDKVTQHNASLVEETATISEEMAKLSSEMQEMTTRFTVRQAGNLRDIRRIRHA